MFKSRNPVVFNDVIFTDTQYKRPLIAELLLRLVSVIPMTVTVVKQFFSPHLGRTIGIRFSLPIKFLT